ncbi:MAG: cobalamin biosynthesis protein CbiX [Verrucomicrobia bacterium]|nr:MAG: cobalamin biosynthesis protein CbiX [Verrucomicrobiota bacterium]
MVQEGYSDASLVLLGHGSTLDAGAGAAVFHQASELRRRKIFAEVREGFWKQEPAVKDVLAELTTPRLFIVPMFVSEGYFSQTVIPRSLGFEIEKDRDANRVQRREGRTIAYCKAIGPHDRMADVLMTRASEVIDQFPFPRPPQPRETTLFIAGHGTEQEENSRRAIEHQARLIQKRQVYDDVHAVFLEEEPRIADCWQMARTRNIVVVPFFISDGLHVKKDIPQLLGGSGLGVARLLQAGQPAWRNPTERNGKLLWYAKSVGTHPMVADIILARVDEAAAWCSEAPKA